MLDKQDLQAIKELIDTSITASEKRTQARLDALDAKIDSVDENLQSRIDSLDAKIDAVDNNLQSRIDAVDENLQSRIGSLDAKIDSVDSQWRVYVENAVMPNLKLLAEGQQTLLETLAPKSRVEALEDEVVFIKSVIKTMNQEIVELKKAQ